MIRTFVSAIQIGLLVVAAIWIAQRPGTIEIHWLGYDVTAHVGLVFLGLIFVVAVILFLHRILLAAGALPGRFRERKENKQYEKGYKELTQGLSAVAAGDAAEASAHAKKNRALWPEDQGLSLLLEAQAARLRGEEEVARLSFDKLLANKDTAFLGLRGLLVHAMETGDTNRALDLAQKAWKMHPEQPWIIRMVYDLGLQQHQWQLAENTLKNAVRYQVVTPQKAQSDRIAMLLARADEAFVKGEDSSALKLFKEAYRLDQSFVPSAQRLAEFYRARGKNRAAQTVIEKTWALNPHPDLIKLWDTLIPRTKKDSSTERLRWFEKLASSRPDSEESHLTMAQVALDAQLWGQAREYLQKAEDIALSARLYKLYATLEDQSGHSADAYEWQEKAATAPPEKKWVCKQTGMTYEKWSPVAHPHGTFNSIIWDYPNSYAILPLQNNLPQNELLITAK